MLLESTRPLLLFVVVVATAAFIGTIPVDAQDAASASPLACCAPKPGSDIVVTARKENRKGQHYNVLIAETTCMNGLSFNCVLPPNETVCKPVSGAHKGADALRPPWRGLDSPCRQSTAHTCICPPRPPVESVLVPRSAEAFPVLESVSMRHACFLAIVPPSLARANTVLDYPSVGVRDAVTSVESSRLSTFFCHRYKNIVTN